MMMGENQVGCSRTRRATHFLDRCECSSAGQIAIDFPPVCLPSPYDFPDLDGAVCSARYVLELQVRLLDTLFGLVFIKCSLIDPS